MDALVRRKRGKDLRKGTGMADKEQHYAGGHGLGDREYVYRTDDELYRTTEA